MQPSLFSTQSGGTGSGAGGRSATGARAQNVPAPSSGVNSGEVDSWIEVSSHPSDSQYTSSSDDHIIMAGLRISQTRRKRRGTARLTTHPQEPEPDSSSEDEGDGGEDEGEDMGSMIHSMPLSSDGYSSLDDDDEESDDEASASDSNGKVEAVFSPSHPAQRPGVSYRQQTAPAGHSSGNRSHAYAGYNSFAPNHAADHDAALRASLSTLLSCAAAARGLPKSGQSQMLSGSQSQHQQQSGRVAVDSLTLVREGGEPSSPANLTAKDRSLSISSTSTSASRSSSPEQLAKKSGKRSFSAGQKHLPGGKSSSKAKRRSARENSRESEMSLSNISYMNLAISAGAIVVLSAITFSAGYALGREVGKGEGGLLSSVGRSVESGKAVVKGTSRSIGIGTRFTSITAF